uniref:Uncharacterized protein n=1 Tax=Cucumis melo TaxID=3656 RepID=A0A9I9ELC8_CUCME
MKTMTLYHLLLSLLLFAAFQPSPLHLPPMVVFGAKITNKELRSVHHWTSNSMHINGALVSKAFGSAKNCWKIEGRMKGMDRGKFMEAEIDSGGEVSPERNMARKGWERRTDER